MTADSNRSETTQAASVALQRVLRWSGQSPVKLVVVCCGAVAAVLVYGAAKAFAWGLRFHLNPGYWSGVYQRHPILIPLIVAAGGLFLSIIGAAVVLILKGRKLSRGARP